MGFTAAQIIYNLLECFSPKQINMWFISILCWRNKEYAFSHTYIYFIQKGFLYYCVGEKPYRVTFPLSIICTQTPLTILYNCYAIASNTVYYYHKMNQKSRKEKRIFQTPFYNEWVLQNDKRGFSSKMCHTQENHYKVDVCTV